MFGLSLLSPAFLIGAVVAALPIALHLIGRRPRARVMFPAVRLLEQSAAQETRKRRFRDLLVLALRVAAIVLLARYERELRVAGIDYCLLDTSKPLDGALMAYLHTRGKKR